jgi:hypothetical protein
MTSEITVNYNSFNANNLTFTKLEENNRSKGQLISYSRYDPTNSGKDGALFLQSPWFKLFTYGVPRLGEYYKTDADRSHLRVPFDLTDPDVLSFVNKIKDIDTKFSNSDMMQTMIGKKYTKYKYQTIYREGQDQVNDDSDDETEKVNKDAPPRPPYMKVKLDTSYPDNEVRTQVFLSELDKNNKRIRTKLDNIKTIDDFANTVRFLSNVRLIIRPVKYWAHQATKKDPQCGIVWKLVKIEVEPPKSSNTMYKQIYESDNFIDSDTEESLPKPPTLNKLLTLVDSVSNETNSDESSDNEESLQVKNNNIVEVDSDDSDEEIVVEDEDESNTIKVESDSEEESSKTLSRTVSKPAKGKKTIKSTSTKSK